MDETGQGDQAVGHADTSAGPTGTREPTASTPEGTASTPATDAPAGPVSSRTGTARTLEPAMDTPEGTASTPATDAPAGPVSPRTGTARPREPAMDTPAAPTAEAAPPTADGGEVRRRLDRVPGDRYRQPSPAATGPTRTRRLGAAAVVALGTTVVTFALITFDVGPGLLVIGLVGGWLTGLALAGGAPAGRGEGAGRGRAAGSAVLAIAGLTGGLLLDALRAYAIGGVLLPWEYALARFGLLAPVAGVLAAVAGAMRGR